MEAEDIGGSPLQGSSPYSCSRILNGRDVANHVATDVAKTPSDVAKSTIQVGNIICRWQHLRPALNTERAFAAVFRLSLSDLGMNL